MGKVPFCCRPLACLFDFVVTLCKRKSKMSASELIDFANGLDWEKWITEDSSVRKAVNRIKKRVEGGDVVSS